MREAVVQSASICTTIALLYIYLMSSEMNEATVVNLQSVTLHPTTIKYAKKKQQQLCPCRPQRGKLQTNISKPQQIT